MIYDIEFFEMRERIDWIGKKLDGQKMDITYSQLLENQDKKQMANFMMAGPPVWIGEIK